MKRLVVMDLTQHNRAAFMEESRVLPNYAVQINTLPDERLEALVSDWLVYRQNDYHSRQRWSGPGDLGRDVVGYVTPDRHEGDWDNFQCKQLSARLTEPAALLELAKIFMHTAAGEYRLPRAYYFIAPHGITRTAKSLIAHPERFRKAFLDRWDTELADRLVEKSTVPLSNPIVAAITAFDFKNVYALDSVALADDPCMKPVLVAWFGADPGSAPTADVPSVIQPVEAVYVGQLLSLYSMQAGQSFIGPDDVLQHPQWGQHFRDQRTRFFEAVEFNRYYRDSTPPDFLLTFKSDIYHGVIDVYNDPELKNDFARLIKVMAQAAAVQPSGLLGKHARVPAKQGACHHFANDGKMPWTR